MGMEITIDYQSQSKVAVIDSDDVLIDDVQSALDVMASVKYNHDCNKIMLRQCNLSGDFFELKTRLAGEVLQKYINYHVKLAIVGDFGKYNSTSLNDFIYECNKGQNVCFAASRQNALRALHLAD